jgi:orotidine-5'-phosphate decarboxylase
MSIPPESIIIALDYPSISDAMKLLQQLEGYPVWVKVGMELFYGDGPGIVYAAKERGFRIFLDLKLHDIPNTVEKTMKVLCKLPIDMVNVHAAGGSEMMKRASEAVKSSLSSPSLLAVTQLTSTTTEQMNVEQRIPGNIQESILTYSRLAKESGCDGVVCSPHEVPIVKGSLGKSFLTVTPGIRPSSEDYWDQKRVTTPLEAIKLGTNYMVIGRPITGAMAPRTALEDLLKGSL